MTIECEHGQLARSCNICEYEKEIADLKQEINRLQQWINDLQSGGMYINCVYCGHYCYGGCSQIRRRSPNCATFVPWRKL